MLFHRHHHHTPISDIIPDESLQSASYIRKVVRIGCIVNLMLMVLKLCAGHFGHSEALVADGFHSLNDVAADLIMLVFVGISYRASDDRYAYGYGKFETFSSFLMSVFLIFISVMIAIEGGESVKAYFDGEILDRPDIWTLIVVLFSMGCKEGLYRFYSGAGRRAGSKALVANAWHHRSDALASVATLIGVSCAYFFGDKFRILDPVASLVIACFIFGAAVNMLRPAFGELMEHSLPKEMVEKARAAISGVTGVQRLVSLKSRRNGHKLIFDAKIAIAPHLTIEQGAEITGNIENALKEAFCPHIILSVITEPANKR